MGQKMSACLRPGARDTRGDTPSDTTPDHDDAPGDAHGDEPVGDPATLQADQLQADQLLQARVDELIMPIFNYMTSLDYVTDAVSEWAGKKGMELVGRVVMNPKLLEPDYQRKNEFIRECARVLPDEATAETMVAAEKLKFLYGLVGSESLVFHENPDRGHMVFKDPEQEFVTEATLVLTPNPYEVMRCVYVIPTELASLALPVAIVTTKKRNPMNLRRGLFRTMSI